MSRIVTAHPRARKSSLAQVLEALKHGDALRAPGFNASRVAWASPSASVSQLQDGWADLLDNWPWDLFCTFTVRDALAPEAIDKRYRLLISEANRDLYGRRWAKRGLGIRWARAWEPQRRGVLHLHALWGETRDIRTSKCRTRWEQLCCRPGEKYNPEKPAGIARLERIESNAAVRHYVSKYVSKGGELDLGGGPFRFSGDQPSHWPSRIGRRGLSSTALGKDVLNRLRESLPDDEWAALLDACQRHRFDDPLLAHVRATVRGERASKCDPTPGDVAASVSLARAARSPLASGQVLRS